jgi:hypothetical protein
MWIAHFGEALNLSIHLLLVILWFKSDFLCWSKCSVSQANFDGTDGLTDSIKTLLIGDASHLAAIPWH